jgi:hypothetical protein
MAFPIRSCCALVAVRQRLEAHFSVEPLTQEHPCLESRSLLPSDTASVYAKAIRRVPVGCSRVATVLCRAVPP